MKTYIVQDRQSLLDIGLQQSGSIEGAVAIAYTLGVALSDELKPGMEIKYETTTIDSRVVIAYQRNNVCPATVLDLGKDFMGGIDFMGIEIDFLIR